MKVRVYNFNDEKAIIIRYNTTFSIYLLNDREDTFLNP